MTISVDYTTNLEKLRIDAANESLHKLDRAECWMELAFLCGDDYNAAYKAFKEAYDLIREV